MKRILLAISLCIVTIHIAPKIETTPREQANDVWITIFIHGTLGLRYMLKPNLLPKLMTDRIENTSYERAISLMRSNPVFFKNQAMQTEGLHPIDCSGISACSLFAHFYDDIQRETQRGSRYTDYYTFGWSGLLSNTDRFYHAHILYDKIRSLKKEYEDNGYNPHLSIVGYSHGGALALYLPLIFEEQDKTPFTIDELILIGTPVQRETDCYICSPHIKKAYNLYSRADCVQIMDCFSLDRFFSSRHFASNARCILPQSLKQIEVKMNMPMDPARKKAAPRRSRINMSPGHIEFWFFGWPESSQFYRSQFPYRPLPFACFIPKILDAADTAASSKIVTEIRPTEDEIIIRPLHSNNKTKRPFIPHKRIEKLQQQANNYKPDFIDNELRKYYAKRAKTISKL